MTVPSWNGSSAAGRPSDAGAVASTTASPTPAGCAAGIVEASVAARVSLNPLVKGLGG